MMEKRVIDKDMETLLKKFLNKDEFELLKKIIKSRGKLNSQGGD